MEDYESWMRRELDAARAKVRETECALEFFLAWRASNPAASIAPRASNISSGSAANSGRRVRIKLLRTSKNEPIFRAFEAAGADGLTQEQVQEIARRNGLNSSASALRALCWTAKESGRLISLAPGRYAIAHRDEAAPGLSVNNGDGDAASARQDHNQHREGDAGGGT